jgi:signal transduction histidine kinase
VLANEVVHIQAIGAQIYSMLSMRASPGVRLEVDCPNIKFRGDITRWTQLLLNLVQNSLKFTASGFVRLGIYAGAPCPSGGGRQQLHVQVADTGRGITPSGQAALFQKYQQVRG